MEVPHRWRERSSQTKPGITLWTFEILQKRIVHWKFRRMKLMQPLCHQGVADLETTPGLSASWPWPVGASAGIGGRGRTLTFPILEALAEGLRRSIRKSVLSQCLTNDHLSFGKDHCARRARRHPNRAPIQEYFQDKRGASSCPPWFGIVPQLGEIDRAVPDRK